LSKDDWKEVSRLSEIGFRRLSSAAKYSDIAGFVLENHERYGGTGYPKSLKGSEISLEVSIIVLADAYDVMTYDRTYKKALSQEEALEKIKREK